MQAVVGREAELRLIADFLDQCRLGPAAALVSGEGGMGKSTLWRKGLETARGRAFRVLRCEPVPAEASLGYVAVADLLDPMADQVLPRLARPQARALEAALLRATVRTARVDRRMVSLAALNAVRLIAEEGPLLLAVDGAEWLDVRSAHVLEFVVRRLRAERVGLLATRGTEAGEWMSGIDAALRCWRIDLAPLAPELVDELLRARLGCAPERGALERGALERVRALSRGNPLFALEIGESMLRCDDLGGGPRRPLVVPARLRPHIRRSLADLPAGVRAVLLMAAALSDPTRGTLVAALPPSAERAVRDAIDRGLLEESGGRLRASHPLLGEALYSECPLARRRRIHGRLARVVEDPEERARHAALASGAPDAGVADVLDHAVRSARTRGRPEVAATLAEEAHRFTPAGRSDDAARRALDAARLYFEAADTARARAVLDQFLASSPPAGQRARALLQRAQVECHATSVAAAIATLGDAQHHAAWEPAVRTAIHEARCWADVLRGDPRSAAGHAAAALRLADRQGREDLRVSAGAAVAITTGSSGARAAAGRSALAPAAWLAAGTMVATSDGGPGARALHLAEYERSRDCGNRIAALVALVRLALEEAQAGLWRDAMAHAAAACDLAPPAGLVVTRSIALGTRARVEALTGRVGAARATSDEAMALAGLAGSPCSLAIAAGARGVLELSLGDPVAAYAAMAQLDSLVEAAGIADPGWVAFWFVPDQVEALVDLGELGRAESLLRAFEGSARAGGRAAALATAARCQARLEAARGDIGGAVRRAELALRQHERSDQPFERARTLLLLGRLLRRTKKRRRAREALTHALRVFEELGAPLWAECARTDLARLRQPVSPRTRALTSTEERVARLAASGKTDREIAGALFLSVRTVGVNLSRVYQKLGYRSRTELAAHLASDPRALRAGPATELV